MQELFSSCVCHVTFMPHPQHSAMMYSLQLTGLSCPVILSQPLRMYYKKSMIPIPDLRNAIGIIRPIKLFPLTWSKNLFSDLPFTIQALPIITPYPVVYNTNLGYTITQEG